LKVTGGGTYEIDGESHAVASFLDDGYALLGLTASEVYNFYAAAAKISEDGNELYDILSFGVVAKGKDGVELLVMGFMHEKVKSNKETRAYCWPLPSGKPKHYPISRLTILPNYPTLEESTVEAAKNYC